MRESDETLFFAPAKALGMLVDAGIPSVDAVEHLVRLKDTEFCIRYDRTSYFDPRELQRIIDAK